MNTSIKPILLSLSLIFTATTPSIVLADDCEVSCAKGSNRIDCPDKGCGCWCDENDEAKCKCTQPLDNVKPDTKPDHQ